MTMTMKTEHYVLDWTERTIRICHADPRGVMRRTSHPDSLRHIDRLQETDLRDADIVRELKHFSGDPFVDFVFDSRPAVEISESAFRRLIAEQDRRERIARDTFERDQSRCADALEHMSDDERSVLPPDELESLRRCAAQHGLGE